MFGRFLSGFLESLSGDVERLDDAVGAPVLMVRSDPPFDGQELKVLTFQESGVARPPSHPAGPASRAQPGPSPATEPIRGGLAIRAPGVSGSLSGLRVGRGGRGRARPCRAPSPPPGRALRSWCSIPPRWATTPQGSPPACCRRRWRRRWKAGTPRVSSCSPGPTPLGPPSPRRSARRSPITRPARSRSATRRRSRTWPIVSPRSAHRPTPSPQRRSRRASRFTAEHTTACSSPRTPGWTPPRPWPPWPGGWPKAAAGSCVESSTPPAGLKASTGWSSPPDTTRARLGDRGPGPGQPRPDQGPHPAV